MHTFDPSWLEKLEELRDEGVNPYPDAATFPISHLSTQLFEAVGDIEDPESAGLGKVSIAGRVMFRNKMGKAMFLRIQDRGDATFTEKDGEQTQQGGRFQVYIRADRVGPEAFSTLKKIDIGDFYGLKAFCLERGRVS